jgi:hypothetical protein
MNKHTIAFGSHSIHFGLLLEHSATAPTIEVAPHELAENFAEAAVHDIRAAQDAKHVAGSTPEDGKHDKLVSQFLRQPIFYKLDGKYIALHNAHLVSEMVNKQVAVIRGKFVSKQLLKKIETVAVPLHVQNRMAETSTTFDQHVRRGDSFGTIGSRMQHPEFYERPMTATPRPQEPRKLAQSGPYGAPGGRKY